MLQLSMYHCMTYNKYNQTVVSIHAGFLTCQKPGMDRKLQNVVYNMNKN